MIGIIDYGAGNLRSVKKALEYFEVEALISSDPKVLATCSKLILPGVGAFASAMQQLSAKGLDSYIVAEVNSGKKILGICLGMQLMMDVSYEHGETKGLSLVAGAVKNFREADGFPSETLVVPHMGWNKVELNNSPLWLDLPEDFYAYFVHSFYVEPLDSSVVIGQTNYGLSFCSALHSGNVYGIQFHPEKSSREGMLILKNFANL